ncbi:aspartate dehydrogenase domain-containing protein-like [Clytia hemisphaerica]|uniref:Aspartate dehydrogenase domain-containing protein n=1 Tax=Clytia hemisphaerica TaxID=252671 RepID=A0A7M6DL87_9CNID
MHEKKRIGIVGYGHIGQYIFDEVQKSENLCVDFVWNRSFDKIKHLPKEVQLENLDEFRTRKVDIILEVAHITTTQKYGEQFLEHANFMIGSPTALADEDLEARLRKKSLETGYGLFVPAGAFWGGEDVQKMADQGSLKGLKVTMKKHPSCFKVLGEVAERNEKVGDEPVVLYEGPVRKLCPLAPANVNTMACAALAAHNLGFDKVQGCLVADRSLKCHIVEIEVTGPPLGDNGEEFTVKTVRTNPSKTGVVTGNATYASFFQSLRRAYGKGGGIHLC